MQTVDRSIEYLKLGIFWCRGAIRRGWIIVVTAADLFLIPFRCDLYLISLSRLLVVFFCASASIT